jgi:hypothetical protein
MRQTIFLLYMSAIMANCGGQTTSKYLTLADVTFNSIFGTAKTDSSNTYCLLGSGFFRTPRSDNSDSLIIDWITKHPKTFVIPISSIGPTMVDDKNSKMTYCWLVDGNDTINNYLIRNGCFPGGTMQRPHEPKVKVLIDKKSFDNFIEQIKVAQKYASDSKLGIWNNPENDDYK